MSDPLSELVATRAPAALIGVDAASTVRQLAGVLVRPSADDSLIPLGALQHRFPVRFGSTATVNATLVHEELAGRWLLVVGAEFLDEASRAVVHELVRRGARVVITVQRERLVADLLEDIDTDRIIAVDIAHSSTPQQTALEEMDPQARSVLTIAALLGECIDISDLQVAAGLPLAEILESLQSAEIGGLLSRISEQWCFNDGMREQISGLVPAVARTEMHRVVAEAFTANGREARAIPHLLAGARTGDAEAIVALTAAADRALDSAPGLAARLYAEVRALLRPGDSRAPDIDRDRLEALLWAGDLVAAQEHAMSCLTHTPVTEPGWRDLQIGLIWALLGQGRFRDGLTAFGPLAAHAEGLETQVMMAIAMLAMGQPEAALGGVPPVSMGPELRHQWPTWLLLAANDVRIMALSTLGDPQMALMEARAGKRFAMEYAGSRRWPSSILLGAKLTECDQPHEALVELAAGRQAYELIGNHWAVAGHVIGQIEAWVVLGDWDSALLEFERLEEEIQRWGIGMGSGVPHAQVASILLHRAEVDAAAAVLQRAHDVLAGGAEAGAEMVELAAVRLLHARGRPDEARGALWALWEKVRDRPLPAVTDIAFQVCLWSEDTDQAREAATVAVAVADRVGVRSVQAKAACAHALAWRDPAKAIQGLGTAELLGHPPLLLLACENAGTVTVDAALLQRARVIAEGLGAMADKRRIDAALRALGARPSVPTPGRQGDLSSAEIEVARLVERGWSNREIAAHRYVSIRTVESQVSSILRKIGGSRRSDITDLIRRGE